MTQKKDEYRSTSRTYIAGGDSIKIYTTKQLEAILRTAFDIEGNNLKTVAEIENINLNTLYKWNCGAMRFSPDNIDKLLIYFQEHEPARLERAERIYDALCGIE